MKLPLTVAAVVALAGCNRPEGVFHGWAEADETRVAPLTTGTLTRLAVERGQTVDAGTLLFTQDCDAERAARDQAEARLAQSQAQLANLEAGGRATEIDSALAQVREARSAFELAQSDLRRTEQLAREGASTQQRLDLARSNAEQTAARLRSAEARLRTLQIPVGRLQEIEAQRAATEMARAALASAEWRLQQRSAVAPASGRVVDTYYRSGEMVPAGAAVLSLLPDGALRVRFFVPEPQLASVRIGAPVRVTCDGCPAPLDAQVSYVSPKPEYTPPVVYAGDARSKLVYLVEARSSALQGLHPGQPLDVRVAR
ncbi:MAG: HlyD family efflux transporter periplasmic adaptor subunit [Myxococcaceae bacterium]|nr:MAG: HlyD family efflux transporter periplasmic adaptor subunit [Myxococcaceae bacterium]